MYATKAYLSEVVEMGGILIRKKQGYMWTKPKTIDIKRVKTGGDGEGGEKNQPFPLFFKEKWTNFEFPSSFFRILSDFNESF